MTPEHAKAILPFITAYAEGKRIQVFYAGHWNDAPDPEFHFNSDKYRIVDADEIFVVCQGAFPLRVFNTLEKAIEWASAKSQVVKYIRSAEK